MPTHYTHCVIGDLSIVLGYITEVDGVPITRLVEHGTQHDMIGSILSKCVSTHRVIGTPSASVMCDDVTVWLVSISEMSQVRSSQR